MDGFTPMHYAAFEHLVSMKLSGFTLLSHSYGLMRTDKIGLMFQHDDRSKTGGVWRLGGGFSIGDGRVREDFQVREDCTSGMTELGRILQAP